jgi:hypothetical protein
MIIIGASAIALWLTGRQIIEARFGMIDDHQIPVFLGTRDHLPFNQIWSSLMMTEAGTWIGRFRPTFYLFKLTEMSIWGTNVHLWYMTVTACFATLLASIWWAARRFVGLWLAGALTLCISLLPMWSTVFSRLGPSEIYGAGFLGLMIFGSDAILFANRRLNRNFGALLLVAATLMAVGMKETFPPLAGGSLAVLLLAAFERKLSPLVATAALAAIILPVAGMVWVVKGQVAGGEDYYEQSLETNSILTFAINGLLASFRETWWAVLPPVALMSTASALLRRPAGQYLKPATLTIAAWAFLLATYAVQCALYRSTDFPMNIRYDFPAMLVTPLTFVVTASYIFLTLRSFLPERAVGLIAVIVAVLTLTFIESKWSSLNNGAELRAAADRNITFSRGFYDQVEKAAAAANRSPSDPVLLEALGPASYEPVFSILSFLKSFGVKNPVSIRFQPDEIPRAKLYDSLQASLSQMQEKGSAEGFVPLRENLDRPHGGCVSIGIEMSPDANCVGFSVKIP